MLNDAILLARAGFSVIWLKKRSKRPVDEKWTAKETMGPEQLRSSYVKGYNCGVRLGEPSRIGEKYLHVVDVDVRKPEYAAEARKTVEKLLKCRFSDFQAVISGSGGASRHLYFITSEPFRSKKLWHSDEKFTDSEGKEHWAAEVELFGTGKQVVLPPSIHPDTGEEYRWQDGEFWADDLFDVDSDLLKEITGQGEPVEYDDEGPLGLPIDEIEAHIADLDLPTWCDDREGWIKLGMALHHEFDGSSEGLRIWNEFSKQSKKFDARVSKQQWRSFRGSDQPVTFASVIKAANDHRYDVIWDSIPDDFEEGDEVDASDFDDDEDEAPRLSAKNVSKTDDGIPAHLMTIPGVLSMAVDHYNATSTTYQPQFAVHTALALGSIVLGRNWKTEADNFTSLYLVNLGVTGSGKEFARRFLSKSLEESGLEGVIGPAKYASEAGIMSELAWKPRHVTVYDEFGRLLDSTRGSGNTNLRDAQTILMSLFGLLGDSARPTAYSTNGKTAQQIEAMRNQVIRRPAVTLLGLSTPETFFDALSQDDVANGFLNRLLVVNSRQPPSVERPKPWKSIPKALREWINDYGKTDDEDFLGGETATEAPDPEVVDFTAGAWARLDEIAQEIIDLQVKYRPMRLDGMLSRSREITMRMALIVALSKGKKRVDEASVDWSWDYVRFYTLETVENAKSKMGATPIVRITEHLAVEIERAGRKGVSQRDMGRISYEFRKLDKRSQEEVIYALTTHHDIAQAKVKASGDRGGRPSLRYVHIDYID